MALYRNQPQPVPFVCGLEGLQKQVPSQRTNRHRQRQGQSLSSVANRTNDVMKVLTIMASLFIPLTFMAGIYGMNFEHMPELHVRWAYPAIWAAMGLTASGMLFYFWRKSPMVSLL